MTFPGAEPERNTDPLRPVNGASFPSWAEGRADDLAGRGGWPPPASEPAQGPLSPPVAGPSARPGEGPPVSPGTAAPASPLWEQPAAWRSPTDPGASQVEVPGEPGRRRPGRSVAVLAAVAVVVAALGAPLGWLWALLAPTVPVRMTDNGPVLIETQPEEFIAADGWFTLLGVGFGGIAAVVVWTVLRRSRGPAALVAVTLGAIGAGAVAWWLGRQLGLTEYERLLREAASGTTFDKPADLRAAEVAWLFGVIPYVWGNVLVPGLAAAVAYTLLAGWSRYPSLRPEPVLPPYRYDPERYDEERDGDEAEPPTWGSMPISWGSTAPPAPPTAPAPPAPGEAAPPRD